MVIVMSLEIQNFVQSCCIARVPSTRDLLQEFSLCSDIGKTLTFGTVSNTITNYIMDLQFMIYSILIYIEILVYISCILLLVQYNFALLLSPILVNPRYSQWERPKLLPWSLAGDSLVRTESAQVNPMYSQWERPELLPWSPAGDSLVCTESAQVNPMYSQ